MYIYKHHSSDFQLKTMTGSGTRKKSWKMAVYLNLAVGTSHVMGAYSYLIRNDNLMEGISKQMNHKQIFKYVTVQCNFFIQAFMMTMSYKTLPPVTAHFFDMSTLLNVIHLSC